MSELLPNQMQSCAGCEFFQRDEAGRISFTCDPFGNVKEPACLLKWQLIKINQMVDAYQTTLRYYEKLAPMQDRLFKAMEHELGDMDESEKWKQPGDDEEETDER
jgi:hypothetical protein